MEPPGVELATSRFQVRRAKLLHHVPLVSMTNECSVILGHNFAHFFYLIKQFTLVCGSIIIISTNLSLIIWIRKIPIYELCLGLLYIFLWSVSQSTVLKLSWNDKITRKINEKIGLNVLIWYVLILGFVSLIFQKSTEDEHQGRGLKLEKNITDIIDIANILSWKYLYRIDFLKMVSTHHYGTVYAAELPTRRVGPNTMLSSDIERCLTRHVAVTFQLGWHVALTLHST